MTRKLEPEMKAATIIGIVSSLLVSLILGGLVYTFINPAAGILTILILFALFLTAHYFSYKSQEYKISESEIQFYEGFINIEKRNIAFDRVTDIKMEQSIEQRFFGTGDIKIHTAGTSTHEVKLEYLDSPEEVYEDLRDKASIS